MRSSSLRSYAGQAALPGGKADTLLETPLQTARREAFEEIGLPQPIYPPATKHPSGDLSPTSSEPSLDTPGLPYPFRIEHLCQLPTNLAKTELGVRPIVAYLYATSPVDRNNKSVDAETALIPRLDAKEVAAVFSAPFHNFLSRTDEVPVRREDDDPHGKWYEGSWTDWHETRFRMHNFYVPVKGRVVTRPRKKKLEQAKDERNREFRAPPYPVQQQVGQPKATSQAPQAPLYPPSNRTNPLPYGDYPNPDTPDPLDEVARFRVFGMTARILVDCARVAYAEEPKFEHNSHMGDETVIRRLIDVGRFDSERKKGDEFDGNSLRESLHLSGSRGNL